MAKQDERRTYAANPADLPQGTLVELFFEAVDTHRKADALRAKDGEWFSISHAELEQGVRHLVLGLQALGLETGERVAILSENRPEWALVDYAALCYATPNVPIYATLPPNQVAYILRDSGARVAFVSTEDQLAKVVEAWPDLPELAGVIVFDDIEADDDRIMTLSTVLDLGRQEEEAGRGGDFREQALTADPSSIATILYTSGTTGEPKGVMLTHDNIYSNIRAVEKLVDVGPDDVTLSFLPLSHILQRMVDYFLFWRGVTIAYVRSFDLVGPSMVEVRPTVVVSTPRVYEKVYAAILSATGIRRKLVLWARDVGLRYADAKLEGRRASPTLRLQYGLADRLVFRKVRKAIGGRLRFFISGAAPLSPEIAKFFYAAGILILEGYGLTETSPVTNVNRPDDFKFGTVGKPIPGTEIMIAEDGEILVRGPQVMKGYFKQPEATAEAITEEGWFHTGDVGELDAEGYLRITDRKKDLIVTAGGKNIAPQPIENQVKTSRYIAEAVVLGDRRPYPILLIVPEWGQVMGWARERGIGSTDRSALVSDSRVRELFESEIERKLEGFARFELPKKFALIEDEFTIEAGELTPTLKVRRRVVEKRFHDVIESLYAEQEQVAAR